MLFLFKPFLVRISSSCAGNRLPAMGSRRETMYIPGARFEHHESTMIMACGVRIQTRSGWVGIGYKYPKLCRKIKISGSQWLSPVLSIHSRLVLVAVLALLVDCENLLRTNLVILECRMATWTACLWSMSCFWNGISWGIEDARSLPRERKSLNSLPSTLVCWHCTLSPPRAGTMRSPSRRTDKLYFIWSDYLIRWRDKKNLSISVQSCGISVRHYADYLLLWRC